MIVKEYLCYLGEVIVESVTGHVTHVKRQYNRVSSTRGMLNVHSGRLAGAGVRLGETEIHTVGNPITVSSAMKFNDMRPGTLSRVTLKMCGYHIDPKKVVPEASTLRMGKYVWDLYKSNRSER